MAVLAAAALLDELMGRNRNIAPNEKAKELNWEDSEYCKYYLVKFCPHDLFVNTRADLGACPKVHDDEVKRLFDTASSTRKLHYQEEFVRFCASMVTEVERKITKGKQRLALSGKSEVTTLTPAQTQRNTEQITLLSERINGLCEEAERAGTEGNVEQAQGLMKLCDQLKDERELLRKQNENSHWSTTAELAAAQEKQMEVCDVCGAFLIVGDAQQRIDDHLMGKQHVGYARLKAALDEISALVQATREERRARYGGGGGGGGLGSDDRRHRERERERHVERERDRSERPDRERPERGERNEKPEKERERGGERGDKREKERHREKDRDRRERRERDSSKRGDRERRHRMERDSGGSHKDFRGGGSSHRHSHRR